MMGTPEEKHKYTLIRDDYTRHGTGWKYECSCGSIGRWTWQSDNVPYHAWLRHLKKKGIYL